jgi:hypothetical protein
MRTRFFHTQQTHDMAIGRKLSRVRGAFLGGCGGMRYRAEASAVNVSHWHQFLNA